jgi:hypothetical protein
MKDNHARNVTVTAEDDSSWSNPVKISQKVRELAQRSRSVLKAGAASAAAHPEVHGEDLRDLRAQVARLQQKIHEQRLRALIPWVDELRRRIES